MKRYKKLIAVLTAAIVLMAPLAAAASGGPVVSRGDSTVEYDNADKLGPFINLVLPTMADDTYEFWFDPEGLLSRFDPEGFNADDRVYFKNHKDAKITISTSAMYSDGSLYRVTYVDGTADFAALFATAGANISATDGSFASNPTWKTGEYAVWSPKGLDWEATTGALSQLGVERDADGKSYGYGEYVNLTWANYEDYFESGVFKTTTGTWEMGTPKVLTRPLTNANEKPIFDGKIYKMSPSSKIADDDLLDYFVITTTLDTSGTYTEYSYEVTGTNLPVYLMDSDGAFVNIVDAFGGYDVDGKANLDVAKGGLVEYEPGDVTYSGSSYEAKITSKSSVKHNIDIELLVYGDEALTYLTTPNGTDGMVYFAIEAESRKVSDATFVTHGSFKEVAKVATSTSGSFATGVDAKATVNAETTNGTYTDHLYQIKDKIDTTLGNDYYRYYQQTNPYEYEELTFKIVGSLYNAKKDDGRDAAWEKYVQDLSKKDSKMPYIEIVFNVVAETDEVEDDDDDDAGIAWTSVNGAVLAGGVNGTAGPISELLSKTVASAELFYDSGSGPASIPLTIISVAPTTNNQLRVNGDYISVRLGPAAAADWTSLVLTFTDTTTMKFDRDYP
jgi:hypothetical protein